MEEIYYHWVMSSHKNVRELGLTELSYIAGIVDGEGTITLTRKVKDGPRQLVVTVSNCEHKLLSFLHKIVGAGSITSKRIYRKEHSQAFTYRLVNRQALSLLEQIHNHLRTYKRERAKLVLKEYLKVTPRNGKYTSTLLKRKGSFEKKFFEILPHNTKNR